jgi:N-acetylmuramoyl-L-alanine amidase
MRFRTATVVLLAVLAAPSLAYAQSPKLLYTRALGQERALRLDTAKPTLRQLRASIAQYESLVRKHPGSGYSDNALWQAANLSLLAFERYGAALDKRKATRLLEQLIAVHPSSSLVPRAKAMLQQVEDTPAPAPPLPAPAAAAPSVTVPAPTGTTATSSAITIRDVKRTALPDGVRVTVEMDAEASFHAERLENPKRVFFDIKGGRAAASLIDSSLKFQEDLVREIRFGRHPNATRIVMDMEGADSYSVFTLYDPFRLVVDFKRSAPVPTTATVPPPAPVAPPVSVPAPPPPEKAVEKPAVENSPIVDLKPIPTRPITATPALPSVNRDGTFSLARQLGLGISRIVIDAGHGGHDPGAMSNGLSEAELTLDIALRLSRLLQKQPGMDVVMTRATDVFIPLEERTAIANREGADLFLSIHANASRNTKARGVETYFLNFATNPEAEAIAARENAGSVQTMGRLPEIVRAIALHNKLDESRDFATIVQRAMVRRLQTRNKQLRDLGVKQAPFVVLIGAAMPSVLAEISFVTNKQEGALLKTNAYRQQIAEALLDAILRYQQSLKKSRSAATTSQTR